MATLLECREKATSVVLFGRHVTVHLPFGIVPLVPPTGTPPS